MNKPVLTILAAALCTLGACGSESADRPTPPATTPAPSTATDQAAQAPPAPTRQTAQGTMELFAQAMAEANFKGVLEIVDPASEGYPDYQEMYKTLDPEMANPDVPPNVLEFLTNALTRPWKGAEVTVVAESGPRAQAVATLANGTTKTVELNQFNDQWFVLASKDLINPGPPTEPSPANGAGG